MAELFPVQNHSKENIKFAPLADRVRPQTIDDLIGQEHLVGQDAPLRTFFEKKEFPSIIFWGPPGVGKTTIATMISEYIDSHYIRMSAIEAGVKEVRQVIENAKRYLQSGQRTLLFIDEIHRFNKSQQDALLHAVERGIITLIGATTENPSFEVNSALLSRCQVYKLKELSEDNIIKICNSALEKDILLSSEKVEIKDWDFLLRVSGGDARSALNALELSFKIAKKKNGVKEIDADTIQKALQQKFSYYDKKGENHYDTISAFIKSLRGSDPDAALFWLAKMLDAGEDPKFIARRLVIFASEDVGNADVYALTLANSVFRAVEIIGLPECRINLAQGVTYLASCPKSNAAYFAIKKAEVFIKQIPRHTVPLHLRNAPTKLMKDEGYGKEYKYPHDYPNSFIKENYFPEEVPAQAFYNAKAVGREEFFKKRLEYMWPERYGLSQNINQEENQDEIQNND